jgi:hypothetical protein
MAKSRALENTLAALGALRREPVTEQTIDALRQGLRAKGSHVVGSRAGERGLGLRVLAGDMARRSTVSPIREATGVPGAIESRVPSTAGQIPGQCSRAASTPPARLVFGGREDTAPGLRSRTASLVRVGPGPDARDALVALGTTGTTTG